MTDLTPSILIEIRDSIRALDARVNARIDQTNAALEHMSKTMSAHWLEHEEWLRNHDVRIRRVERKGRRSPHGPRRRT